MPVKDPRTRPTQLSAAPPPISIGIEVSDDLSGMAYARSHDIEWRLELALAGLLERLGLPGAPQISCTATASRQTVKVRVGDSLRRYSPELLHQAWRVTAPAHLSDVPERYSTSEPTKSPDDWLKRWAVDDSSAPEVWPELVARLVFEIIQQEPACMLHPAHVETVQQLGYGTPVDALPSEAVFAGLRLLLEHGVSIGDASFVADTIRRSLESGAEAADTAERLLARVAEPRVEVRMHPSYIEETFPGVSADASVDLTHELIDRPVRELFREMRDSLYETIGIDLVTVVAVPTHTVAPGWIVVRLNDVDCLSVPGLRSGEALVAAPRMALEPAVQVLREFHDENIPGGTSVVTDADAGPIGEVGVAIWRPAQRVVQAIAIGVHARADRLLTSEQIEMRLAELDAASVSSVGAPHAGVVSAILRRLSPEELTRVVRALLRESVGIRDLRWILERLLEFDTVTVHSPLFRVYGEPMPWDAADLDPPESTPARVEFVRRGMCQALTARHEEDGRLPVYTLSDELLAIAVNVARAQGSAGHTEADHDDFLDALWRGLAGRPPAATVLLVDGHARRAVRQMTASELPGLTVLAREEVHSGLEPIPLGTITRD